MNNVNTSIKQEAHEIIDNLPDDASWDDLVKSLYREHKITLGMNDLEVVQKNLSDEEISSIMGRLESSSSQPADMRNTKTYNPGNNMTAAWALVALAPLLFISLIMTPAAYVISVIGIFFSFKAMAKQEQGAIVPLGIGIIELILFIAIPVLGH